MSQHHRVSRAGRCRHQCWRQAQSESAHSQLRRQRLGGAVLGGGGRRGWQWCCRQHCRQLGIHAVAVQVPQHSGAARSSLSCYRITSATLILLRWLLLALPLLAFKYACTPHIWVCGAQQVVQQHGMRLWCRRERSRCRCQRACRGACICSERAQAQRCDAAHTVQRQLLVVGGAALCAAGVGCRRSHSSICQQVATACMGEQPVPSEIWRENVLSVKLFCSHSATAGDGQHGMSICMPKEANTHLLQLQPAAHCTRQPIAAGHLAGGSRRNAAMIRCSAAPTGAGTWHCIRASVARRLSSGHVMRCAQDNHAWSAQLAPANIWYTCA